MFLINSRSPLICDTQNGSPFFRSYRVNLPSSFKMIASTTEQITCIITRVGFKYVQSQRVFSWNLDSQISLIFTWNIWRISSSALWVPIDKGVLHHRPRDQFTLRRSTVRRKLWNFVDRFFQTILRYSCQHSFFWLMKFSSRLNTEYFATI